MTVIEDVKSVIKPLEVALNVGVSTTQAEIDQQIAKLKAQLGDDISVVLNVETAAKAIEAKIEPVIEPVVAEVEKIAEAAAPAAQAVVDKVKALNEASWLQYEEKEAFKLKPIEQRFEEGVAATEKLFASPNISAKTKAAAAKVLAEARALAADIKAKLKPATPVVAAELSALATVNKGVVGNALSFAGKAVTGTLGGVTLALGAALKAPFKLPGLIPGIGVKAGLWALLALGVGGSVFAGYLHMEHNTERLIAQAREAATQDMVAQYRGISEELARQQAFVRSQALSDLIAADKASDAEVDAAEQSLEDATVIEPIIEPDAPLPPSKPKVKHGNHKVPAIDHLNAGDAGADRMLERRSRH